MASIYDNIKTAKELVREASVHGFSTNQEDICRAQDIIGHSTIEELDWLANDIGRENENGEPDPNGTCYSGRRGTRDIFYSILFNIWNYEQATRFWNEHTNPERKELNDLRQKNKVMDALAEKVTARNDELEKQTEQAAQEIGKLHEELAEEKRRADEAEAEIIKLKARLYDLLVK